MALSAQTEAFVNDPEVVDFAVRADEYFLDYARRSGIPMVIQELSGGYVVGYLQQQKFRQFLQDSGVGRVSAASTVLGLLDRPELEAAGILAVQNQPYLGLKGRGVLLGFVDTGIDYTLPVFRYEDGTSKIQWIYDQTARDGAPPQGFLYGREYSGEEISRALSAPDPYQVVPQRDQTGHGTFLASVAAGRITEEFMGAAPDGEIIAVKLRGAREFYREKYCVPPDQTEAFESGDIMVGVEYILRRARAMGRPVVICLGVGTNFGGHDGFSVFESYLSEAAVRRGVCLCAAAGNEAQERHHAEGRIPSQGETAELPLKVGERAGDVWLSVWNTAADRFSVSVRSPSGELVGRIPARPGEQREVKLLLEDTRVQVEYYFPVEGSGGQLTVIRILNAAPGIWTITLYGDLILDGGYHAWLPIRGFVSPTVEFLNASPNCTVTIPATAVGVLCCGAYNSIQGNIWPNSSWGPARSGARLPDLAAPGVAVGGWFPYGYGSLSGTSAAAAVLAGACALMMQWGVVEGNEPSMSTYQIRAYLIRGAVRSGALRYPNDQWGYGALQLMQAFHLMREL